ncbi:type IX secretion system sortase PorU [Frigoriflavimonas asaccharolytica]|uniref:Gingipain domain-containing protein n=1 Tax=Frigoriflavimonas asaccharolytica TaxID=2735899 RepID=A0A8J8GBR1_9FLAO|nr:type IX secretion system sortase PorU [Frigoriflavimonas asaccharolytica]NRS93284.1 hypothetical protein [Frigoriflavimonas asaccharolytica]
MIRLYTFLFLLVFNSFYFSQRVNIQWDGSQIHDFGVAKMNLPHFTNEGFSFDQNNIFINIKQNVPEKNLKIDNIQWDNITGKDLYDLVPNDIADHEISGISYYNGENGSIASINLALFRSFNNQLQRVSSFNLSSGNSTPRQIQKVGTTNNPLSSGDFYKIKVDKSGIFKITSQFLQSNGINPGNVNPKNFRIYGNGGVMLSEFNQNTKYDALQENAIQVVGEDDGVWNTGDFALFYAQGPDGYNLYDTTNGNGFKRTDTRTDRSNNVKNIYEDVSYYFINFDKGPGKRVQLQDEVLPANLITRYDDFQFINKDEVNLLKLGRLWLDAAFFSTPKTVTFNTNSPIQAGDLIRYRTQVVGSNAQGTNIQFNVNSQNNSTQTVPSGAAQIFIPLRYSGFVSNLSGNSISINYTPNVTINPNGVFYLDYAEVQYKENLNFNGSQMNFRDFSLQSGSGTLYGFSVANATAMDQIWDVSDLTNASRKVNKASNNSTFNFGYSTNSPVFNNEFVAFRADAAFSPAFVGKITNQNLKGLQNVDYVILTQPQMIPQAQRLANYHQTKNNYNVQIVDINKIYNEYSSGSQDMTAIRDFITELNRPAGTLKYVFILGDATYDFKNRTPNNFNIVPGFQSEYSADFVNSYVTDDYFAMTQPQTSTFIPGIIPDIPVGRIPAANITEATNMIDKTLGYYNALPGQSTPFGVWRMKLDFFADDDNDGGTPFHTVMNSALVQTFEGTSDKPEYNVRKAYNDSFPAISTAGGQRYPQVNQIISNDISNSMYMFYFGHGGPNGWSQERILTSDEVSNFNNFNQIYSRTPFVSTITCEFTLWDEPNVFSTGEQTMKLKNGGASSMITSSRAIDVGYGVLFTAEFTRTMFKLLNDDFKTLGDAHLEAKQNFGGNSNHFKVNFFGDPAMKMSRPKRLIQIDNIATPVPNIIRALDFVTITGHINNASGSVDTTFNGKVAINIFDKKVSKSTLNNDGNLVPILNYIEEGSPIVKAAGVAINGQFTVEFYVPNDINYVVGTGRILAYADNNVFDVFTNLPYQIGDINPNGITDSTPPAVRLYMNNTNFANGGITNQNPLLLACITDDTGINSTGSGIGHDITVFLDGQIINTVVLNDFYSPGDGLGCASPNLAEYQKGYVTYPFRNLAPGEHTLTFKVWDINNNSTTETLNFIVKDETDQQLQVKRLLNWPNPFTDKTYIQFEHNCDDILDVNVQIYTITGKLVKTISQSVSGEPFFEGFRTPRQAIMWDGKDDFGDTVGKGTYIFKIFARSQNQDKCKGGATAIEKMVLLK